MSHEKPLVYLILGAPGSGRREIVADLLDGGLEAEERARARVFLSADEPADPIDARLGAVERWHWVDGAIETPSLGGATPVFFVADGRRNPVDQVEAFRAWLLTSDGELGRILCVVHCRLIAEHSQLRAWNDACVHFSDVVLLNRRAGLPNKWVSDFQAHYASQFLPCLFEAVKNGRVKNPAVILEPQARRLSHAFDADLAWEAVEDVDDEEEVEENSEVELTPEENDLYLARRPGGRRAKEIPDIADFLPPLA
jgi:hypothetical protein